MVRQSEYSMGAARSRLRSCLHIVLLAKYIANNSHLSLALCRRVRQVQKYIKNITLRLRFIRNNQFNINAFSEQQCFHDFRFRRNDIGRISKVLGWNLNHSARNRYRSDAVTAAWILLKRLSSGHTSFDMETMSGMRYSYISEVFWNAIEICVECKGFLVTNFQSELMQSRAEIYSNAIEGGGAPLPKFVGFIDRTNFTLCHPGGDANNQRACFPGRTRKHCLKYLTISTPDELIFYILGPQESRRHDMTVSRRSNLESSMETFMNIEGVPYYVYEDPVLVWDHGYKQPLTGRLLQKTSGSTTVRWMQLVLR